MPRARQVPLDLDYETYDGTNADALKAIAGDAWAGMRPVIRNIEGDEVTLGPGWTVHRTARGMVVSSPPAWAERTGVSP